MDDKTDFIAWHPKLIIFVKKTQHITAPFILKTFVRKKYVQNCVIYLKIFCTNVILHQSKFKEAILRQVSQRSQNTTVDWGIT